MVFFRQNDFVLEAYRFFCNYLLYSLLRLFFKIKLC